MKYFDKMDKLYESLIEESVAGRLLNIMAATGQITIESLNANQPSGLISGIISISGERLKFAFKPEIK